MVVAMVTVLVRKGALDPEQSVFGRSMVRYIKCG